ncbi:hypothetical protein Tco_0273387 [Tanacetum coccineum]
MHHTNMEAQTFKGNNNSDMDSIEHCIIEKTLISHEQELKMTLKQLSERQLQIQQCKVQEVQSSVTSSGDEQAVGLYQMKRLKRRNWKHITVSWQRFRKSYLQNQVLLIRHWNRKQNDTKAIKKANASLIKNWE